MDHLAAGGIFDETASLPLLFIYMWPLYCLLWRNCSASFGSFSEGIVAYVDCVSMGEDDSGSSCVAILDYPLPCYS